MFEAIKTNKDLRKLHLKPEARLSDMFMLLYLLYLVALNEKSISKVSIQKLITYLIEDLDKRGLRSKLNYFNLPLYKWIHGTYNKAIEEKYLNELINAGLAKIDPANSFNYILTPQAVKLMDEFSEGINKDKDDEVNIIGDKVSEFSDKFLKDFSFDKIKNYSHKIKVKVNGDVKTVHDLDSDPTVAVIYNNADFQNGKKADIIPDEFLTKLSYIIQESKKPVNDKILIEEEVLSGIL